MECAITFICCLYKERKEGKCEKCSRLMGGQTINSFQIKKKKATDVIAEEAEVVNCVWLACPTRNSFLALFTFERMNLSQSLTEAETENVC